MKYTYKINTLDAGLNTKSSTLQGKDNESPELYNVEFDDVGAVATRKGYVQINSAPIITNADLLHSYRAAGSDARLLYITDPVYRLSGTSSFVPVSGSTGVFSPGIRVHGINANNTAFFSNGVNAYKYNGTDFVRWGVAPAGANAITTITSGIATLPGSAFAGEYYYRTAYINSANMESVASTAKTFVVSGTCAPVNVYFDSVPASAGVAYRATYRNDYLLEVSPVGTSFVTDVHDTLIQERDLTIVDSRPPNINVFVKHAGYMFGANDQTSDLYYTEINQFDSWPPTQLIRVGDGDGYLIKAMAIFNDGLLVCKEDGYGEGKIYVLYLTTSDPTTWTLEELDLSYGGIAPKAIARFGTFLMVLNRYGIFDLSTLNMGVVNSDAISYNIEPDILQFSHEFLKNAVSVAYKNKLWISAPSASVNNNVLYQYDYIRGKSTVGGAWSKFTGMAFKDICIHDGKLMSTDYSGKVYQLDTGNNDNGVAIPSFYSTMFIHGRPEHQDNIKVWRYIYITLATYGNWNLKVSWRGDYSTTDESYYNVNLDAGGSLWGSAIWGVGTFGSSIQQKVVKIPIHVVSKSIQIRFTGTNINEYWKVYNVNLHYSLRGAR